MTDTTTTEDEGYSVATLRRQYLDYSGSKSEEITEQRLARHYYHGDQIAADVLNILKARRQPVLINNRIGRKIDGVVGLVTKMRQDPKAFPRTPKQEQGAEIATAAMRYALDRADWPASDVESARTGAINGVAGVELSLEGGDRGDPEIAIAPLEADTFFYDPRSMRPDFSDARYMGVAKWVDLDVAKEMFPDKAEELGNLVGPGSGLETDQQQDRDRRWSDSDKKRVFLVEHWYIKAGEWRFCFYSASTELGSGVSPFGDETGKTICRFVAFSANVDHDGDRYGFVRNMKSAQDEVNSRRSKALHQLNTRRIITEDGAVEDIEKTRTEAARPDGVVVVAPNRRFEFDDAAKQADIQGQLEFLNEAKNEIENFGPNPALIGQGIENKSGRAISLLQQAGIAELGPFIQAYRGWKIRVYRAVWNAIQRYWTSERWIRVTDNEGLAQFLQLNTLRVDEFGRPTIENAVGSLDVDIILDEGPDTLNVMQDTFDTLMALAHNGVPVPPQVIVTLSGLPSSTKKQVLDMLDKASSGDPEKAAMEKANAAATIEKTRSEAAKNKGAALKSFADASTAFASLGQPAMPDMGSAAVPAAQPVPQTAF